MHAHTICNLIRELNLATVINSAILREKYADEQSVRLFLPLSPPLQDGIPSGRGGTCRAP